LSRELRPFDPTWLDREYRKSLARLDDKAREQAVAELADPLTALQSCRHPVTCPTLAKWKPKPYSVGITGLYEYTLGPLSRVIARCQDAKADGSVLLVAATLSHDHPRIKRIIAEHKTRIKSD
jgi:hypothetical protein